MSRNFANARKLRRSIIAELEQQQKADSEAAVKIRICILASTKDLLESLAALLESYSPDRHIDQKQRELFFNIAPSVSLDEWVRLRNEYAVLQCKAESLNERLRQAQKSYDEVAPLGIVSRLFKSENEKHVFDALKSNRDKHYGNLSAVNVESQSLERRIQEKAREFLNEAMSKGSLEHLRTVPSPVSSQIKETLSKMRDEVQQLTDSHSAVQSTSLTKVQGSVTALTTSYASGQNILDNQQ